MKATKTPLSYNGVYYNSDVLEFIVSSNCPLADLVLFSPPYPLKEKRYSKAATTRGVYEWADWTAAVITAMAKKCRGDIFMVVNDTVADGQCHPATAILRTKLYAQGIIEDRPIVWWKNSAPNRGGYFRNDYENILCFKGQFGYRRYYDPKVLGQPPKFRTGGNFRGRSNNGGARVAGGSYPTVKIANPPDVLPVDVLRCTVGGGHMGFDAEDSALACRGKAPFPFTLARAIVQTFAKPGSLVTDPFAGTGTTWLAANEHGCRFIGNDNDDEVRKIATQRMDRFVKLKSKPGGKDRG